MAKLWFRAKRYGWGWYPSSIEGWLVILGFAAIHTAVIATFIRWITYAETEDQSQSMYAFAMLFAWCVIFITGLLWVCYKKGEKPGWHWGDRK